MKLRFAPLTLLAALTAAAYLTGSALAQNQADTMLAKPMFVRMQPHLRADVQTAVTKLPTWNGSFIFQSKTYKYNMVGTAPSTGTSTTIPVFIIPLKMVYKIGTTTVTFDPQHKLKNGQTVVQNTVASPIFQSGIDFMQGGTDLGNTQYIDAFQRGNFWKTVKLKPGYHLLLGAPTILPEITISVPAADGGVGTEFGMKVGLADGNWFDGKVQAIIAGNSKIAPNTLPIFLTYNVYLTDPSFGCCVGGYHSAFGSVSAPQSYSYSTYIGKTGAFAQDVSVLSHEIGEWADDPLVVNFNGNNTPCGALEVGDPEESFANFGTFPYTLNGFTYNLQDLTWLPYFGAPTTMSANMWLTFQGNPFGMTICSQGS